MEQDGGSGAHGRDHTHLEEKRNGRQGRNLLCHRRAQNTVLERRMRRGVYSGREDAGRYGKEDEPGMPHWSEERARAQHAGQTPPAVQGVTDTMDPTRVCVF